MSEAILITGSICLTTLIEKAKEGHSAFTKSAKDGKIYFNYAEWINDKPNDWGQHSSILLSSAKEKKEAEGKIYVGNGKKFENKPVTNSDLPGDDFGEDVPVRELKKHGPAAANDITDPISDLPF